MCIAIRDNGNLWESASYTYRHVAAHQNRQMTPIPRVICGPNRYKHGVATRQKRAEPY